MALRALVFDFDGTIAETERDGHRVAYNRAFADLGLDWTWSPEHYGHLLAVAGGKERLRAFIDAERPPRPDGDPAALVARIHARKAERFAELADGITLRPGVERLVLEARSCGLRLAIATTAALSGVEAVLASHPELSRSFEVVAAGDVVSAKKPAPDVYRYTLERLGVDARETLALEDGETGLASALAAGVETLVTVSRYGAGGCFGGARAVLSDLGEPGAPARTIAGRTPAGGVVDVAYLRGIVGEG